MVGPTSKTSRPRFLTADELTQTRGHLERLAKDLDRGVDDLRSNPSNELLLPEMRKVMSRAGRTLARLLHHRAIAPPARLPPWLSWRTRSNGERPRFCASYAPPFLSRWSPSKTVLELVQVLRVGPEVVDRPTLRHPDEDNGPNFIHRHIFIEAVAGWLGRRCKPAVSVVVPEHAVVLGKEQSRLLADEERVLIVLDWVPSEQQQKLLFLELGRACTTACRFLSDALRDASTQPVTPASSTPAPASILPVAVPSEGTAQSTAPREKASARRKEATASEKPSRPSPTVIDATARRLLATALEAGRESGSAYVPTRSDIAAAVSKELKYHIKVESLFGTKEAAAGRTARYPQFMQLWSQIRSATRDARPRRSRVE